MDIVVSSGSGTCVVLSARKCWRRESGYYTDVFGTREENFSAASAQTEVAIGYTSQVDLEGTGWVF
jgi:hypothetical protein